ncbi:MAG: hypothetical protein ACO3EZ_07335 [Prochlorotrichaceae cyanobacterium]
MLLPTEKHTPFSHKYLGDFLVEHGFLSVPQLQVALWDQSQTPEPMRLGEILVLRGWIKRDLLESYIKNIVEPRRQHLHAAPPMANPRIPVLV